MKTVELLGVVSPTKIDYEELPRERFFHGIPNDREKLAQIREDLRKIDRECLPHTIESIENTHRGISAIKGVSLGLLAIKLIQGRRQPDKVHFCLDNNPDSPSYSVPRPFIFNRKLPVVRGFMYALENFAPFAPNIDIDPTLPKTLDEVFAVDCIAQYAASSRFEITPDNLSDEPAFLQHKLHILPSAQKYVNNAPKESIMIAFDNSSVPQEVYDSFSQISVV